jgi:DNA repair protein RecN (Recombination protein N)
MLALKTILARADVVPVLIFDEIDVGIGGRAGYVVGQKLAALARERQVICVTHLPQIACFADAHYRIAKQVDGERTATRITLLDPAERVAELGVMLGGSDSSEKARANASELLERADEWKRGGGVDAIAEAPATARAGRK